MSLISRCQRETLVYWPPASPDNGDPDKYGQLKWDAPVEMTCRWDDKIQEIQTGEMTRVVSRVEIISQSKLQVNGYVYRGTLNDLVYPDDPTCNSDAYPILKVAETPDLRYRQRLYEAWA